MERYGRVPRFTLVFPPQRVAGKPEDDFDALDDCLSAANAEKVNLRVGLSCYACSCWCYSIIMEAPAIARYCKLWLIACSSLIHDVSGSS